MKPILFNTEMVRALLDGRKTVTRRVIKPQPTMTDLSFAENRSDIDQTKVETYKAEIARNIKKAILRDRKPPYQPGDILYVRETWQSFFPEEVTPNQQQGPRSFSGVPAESAKGHYMYFYYRADGEIPEHPEWGHVNWLPSIHMPRKAARIFLRVAGVRAERLQDITVADAINEGAWGGGQPYLPFSLLFKEHPTASCNAIASFAHIWDSTVKPADRPRTGWDANPWVWVIEFARISKEAAE